MEGLQRSTVSFRRQGSSGLVWDDKFLGELNQAAAAAAAQQNEEPQQQKPETSSNDSTTAAINEPINVKTPLRTINTVDRSRSNGGQRGYRTGKVSPAIDPPSPRVSACGFCSAFSKPDNNKRRKAGKKPRSR